MSEEQYLLKKLDIFTVDPVDLKIKKKNTKSWIGGILTICICAVTVCALIFLMIQNEKRQPIITKTTYLTSGLNEPFYGTISFNSDIVDVEFLERFEVFNSNFLNSKCYQNRNKKRYINESDFYLCNFGDSLISQPNGIGFIFPIKVENRLQSLISFEYQENLFYFNKNFILTIKRFENLLCKYKTDLNRTIFNENFVKCFPYKYKSEVFYNEIISTNSSIVSVYDNIGSLYIFQEDSIQILHQNKSLAFLELDTTTQQYKLKAFNFKSGLLSIPYIVVDTCNYELQIKSYTTDLYINNTLFQLLFDTQFKLQKYIGINKYSFFNSNTNCVLEENFAISFNSTHIKYYDASIISFDDNEDIEALSSMEIDFNFNELSQNSSRPIVRNIKVFNTKLYITLFKNKLPDRGSNDIVIISFDLITNKFLQYKDKSKTYYGDSELYINPTLQNPIEIWPIADNDKITIFNLNYDSTVNEILFDTKNGFIFEGNLYLSNFGFFKDDALPISTAKCICINNNCDCSEMITSSYSINPLFKNNINYNSTIGSILINYNNYNLQYNISLKDVLPIVDQNNFISNVHSFEIHDTNIITKQLQRKLYKYTLKYSDNLYTSYDKYTNVYWELDYSFSGFEKEGKCFYPAYVSELSLLTGNILSGDYYIETQKNIDCLYRPFKRYISDLGFDNRQLEKYFCDSYLDSTCVRVKESLNPLLTGIFMLNLSPEMYNTTITSTKDDIFKVLGSIGGIFTSLMTGFVFIKNMIYDYQNKDLFSRYSDDGKYNTNESADSTNEIVKYSYNSKVDVNLQLAEMRLSQLVENKV